MTLNEAFEFHMQCVKAQATGPIPEDMINNLKSIFATGYTLAATRFINMQPRNVETFEALIETVKAEILTHQSETIDLLCDMRERQEGEA